jgi:hypothetical protein
MVIEPAVRSPPASMSPEAESELALKESSTVKASFMTVEPLRIAGPILNLYDIYKNPPKDKKCIAMRR